MKNLIIIIGTIILGCYIFQLIMGENEGSLINESKDFMVNAVKEYVE
ncbi:MAG TPA: hypothetical protein VJ916_09180 [Anaerovoracaceae bacterium]|nr:hypothetical protein [Anaerovoracaceae bacterium]